jgi:indole-3-glycerol phosphate synthase
MTTQTNVLTEILAASRERVRTQTAPSTRFSSALAARRGTGQVAVIAEHKRSSPSAGVIRSDKTLAEVVSAYTQAGAAALSILTEPTQFGGRLGDIVEARTVTELPILRKDFIVDPYQVYEASAAGADAILLIVAAFEDRVDLWALNRLAGNLGLEVLLEVHDATELTTALDMGAPIIGINNRNLATLEVDRQTALDLRDRIPPETIVVAESGYSEPGQIRQLAEAGVDAVLIGEALMRAPDIGSAARAITQATATG